MRRFDLSWWYWAVSAGLLIAEQAGWPAGLPLAIALTAVQLAHFRWREGSFAAFPVQVRTGYLALLLVAAWPPMRWLLWAPTIGTPAQVLFGYCALARTLSLAPWNRREPLSWPLVLRTFTARPVRGNVLQGLSGAA